MEWPRLCTLSLSDARAPSVWLAYLIAKRKLARKPMYQKRPAAGRSLSRERLKLGLSCDNAGAKHKHGASMHAAQPCEFVKCDFDTYSAG